MARELVLVFPEKVTFLRYPLQIVSGPHDFSRPLTLAANELGLIYLSIYLSIKFSKVAPNSSLRLDIDALILEIKKMGWDKFEPDLARKQKRDSECVDSGRPGWCRK